jgi:hypothetical protein
MQGNQYKITSRFLTRKLAGQERVGWFIQNAEDKQTNKKPCQPRTLYPPRLSFRWNDKDFT